MRNKTPPKPETSPPPKPPGHGRNGADAYSGAKTVRIKYDSTTGRPLPECDKGPVYPVRPGR